MIDEEALVGEGRWRRIGVVVLAVVALGVACASVVAWIAYQRYESYGTVWADRTPPRIDRCGRRWQRSPGASPSSGVRAGLVEVGSTPGGGAIFSGHAGCPDTTTVIWVRLSGNRFVAYELLGGP